VSPPPLSDGTRAIPNVTPSQFKSAFGDKGFSCNDPVELAGQWATTCTETSDTVVAFGSDAQTINVVMATARAGQAGQLFDTVIQGVCPPADVGPISAWAHAHLDSGGDADIDGYHVSIAGLAGIFALTIDRTQ
jgi:hypothetical protein